MKKFIMLAGSISLILSTFLLPATAFAQNNWTYEQTFNTLNDGNLDGQDGWVGPTSYNVVTTDSPYEGSKHIKKLANEGSDNYQIIKDLPSTIESGTFYVSIKKSSITNDSFSFFVRNQNGITDVDISFGPTGGTLGNGKIGYYSRTAGQWIQIDSLTYSADVYYRIGVQFEFSTNGYEGLSQRTFKVNVDGGPWSSALEMERTNGTGATGISFASEDITTTDYFDFISPNFSSEPTPITGSRTVNRIAKFIDATTLGDSLFSDNGSNTTLTSGNLFMQVNSIIDSITNGALNFGTSLATTMTFGRSGQNMIINSKVGIGTSTPFSTLDVNGGFSANTISTNSNCKSTASPAVCSSAPAGSVAMPIGNNSTLIVNTTAVTPDSQIFVTEDSSLNSRLGITCNTTGGRTYSIGGRTVNTNFTIKANGNILKNEACISYFIIN
jgi:hypothetical protein